MNADLEHLVTSMSDRAALRLAVAMQQELDDDASSSALARLDPSAAEAFLAQLAALATRMELAADETEVAAVAREFLAVLLRAGVFDELIADNALSGGVRAFGVDDIVTWFKASFNLANLVGLRFEYVSERKEVRRTETGSVRTTRTIRVGIGPKP